MIATESLRGSRLLVVVLAVALAASSLVVNHSGAKAVTSAITEYPITTAAGPDGNLWVTELTGGKIARVTTAGAFTEFATPTSGSPAVITAGPDGNLWFNEYGVNKVAKVTTAGVFTEYPITTAASGTSFITAGPDGNLWFTESNADKVGVITTAGTVTEYPVPTASSTPRGIR